MEPEKGSNAIHQRYRLIADLLGFSPTLFLVHTRHWMVNAWESECPVLRQTIRFAPALTNIAVIFTGHVPIRPGNPISARGLNLEVAN